MNLDYAWRPGDPPPTVAVAVTRTPMGNTHVGIIYRLDDRGDEVRFLHLAFHHKLLEEAVAPGLRCASLGDSIFCAVPEIDEIERFLVAVSCRGIARDRPQIPYGFEYHEDGRFELSDCPIRRTSGCRWS